MKYCTSTILCIYEIIFLLPKNPPLFILFCNHQRYFVIFKLFLNIYYFLFLFIPCCSLVFACLFFTFILQIILSPFLPHTFIPNSNFMHVYANVEAVLSQLALYPVAGISTYVFLGISFVFVVET